MRGDGVVPGCDLEVEPGGEDVLAEDRARASRHGEDERDARDRAVLHALRAGGPHDGEAPRLEIEHRATLGVSHQRLGPGPRREAHLHASRRVGRAEERLRPGGVVAVDEDGLGPVHREGLGVGDEPADGELEVPPLLDRALRQHPGPAGLRADEERDRVQRRVAGDADGRLDLGEPASRRLRRVGGEQGRALLQVRHVRLVSGRPTRAELLQREHELDRVEQSDDPCELRRRQSAGEPHELGAGHADVDEETGELRVLHGHRLGRDVEIEPVRDDEAVDHVELGGCTSVQAGDEPRSRRRAQAPGRAARRRRRGRARGAVRPASRGGADARRARRTACYARARRPRSP